MLQTFLRKVVRGPGRYLRLNDIMVCIPSGITEVEKRAVLQAVNEVGARKTFLIEEPIAAAIGAGISVTEPVGSMIVDIGGGTTDIAIISMGGIVVSESLRVAGNHFDQEIVRYVRQKENLLIGDRSAEDIKQKIGAATLGGGDNATLEVRGRDLINSMPRTVTVSTQDVVSALKTPLERIGEGVRKVLEQGPPELISDVTQRGVVMTGGGALLTSLNSYLSELTNIPVVVADNPQDCVVIGTSQALGMIHILPDARARRRY